jgi:hypothetical protein
MSAGTVLGPFLQDIIGRDEVLTPSSGRLRTIHARIVKEVEDAKVSCKPRSGMTSVEA